MTRNMIFKVVNLILVNVCTILLGARLTYAEDIYYAQGSSGDVSGNSCSNAKPISALAWGSGTGNIGAGDMLHLCGTITSTLTIGASGTDLSTNAITIKWEDGAKFSKEVWGTTTSAAIYASGKSNIILDGGTNGLIENTDNGTGKGNSVDSNFIFADSGPSHWEIKNLLLNNVYVRIESTESNRYGSAINIQGAFHDIRVHNNTIHDGNKLVMFAYWGTGVKDVLFYSNTVYNSAVCLTVGSGDVNATIDNVQIYNNTFHRTLAWSGQAAIHTDLTHTFAVHSGSGITNLKIHNNNYSGVCGTNSTTLMYIEGYVRSPQISNNTLMFEANPGACGNGMMYLKSNIGAYVDNNTFVSTDTASNSGLMIGGSTGVVIRNNRFARLHVSISSFDSTSTITSSNYNIFPPETYFNYGSWSQMNFASWKSASGLDTHSTTESSIRIPYYPSGITIR